MDKLLTYRIAGARLTGCKSSVTCVNPPHTRDLVLPTGARLLWRDDRLGADVAVQDGYNSHQLPGLTIDAVLDSWQPDRESSVSRQHYIDAGVYLPVGSVERLALGVIEDDPALDAVRDMPDPRDDALDQIQAIVSQWAEGNSSGHYDTLESIIDVLGHVRPEV